MSVDLPNLDASISTWAEADIANVRELVLNSLYLFNIVCGNTKVSPTFHGPLCEWYDRVRPTAQFCMINIPRDHFKTSVITKAANLRRVMRDPEQRVMLLNEVKGNAELMLRWIRSVAENNTVFRTLFSHRIHKDLRKVRWNDEELDFVREGYYSEASFWAMGMTSALASQHPTHVGIDDPISEDAAKSEAVMKDAIERLSGVMSLLSDPAVDTFDLVGTPWAIHDVYSHHVKTYGRDMLKYIHPVTVKGEIQFPEHITPKALALIRGSMTAYRYSCQYLLKPRNSDVQDLNVEDLRPWGWKDYEDSGIIQLFDKNGNVVEEVSVDKMDITGVVDPAMSEKMTDDDNAISIVGVTPRANCVVLEAWGKRCTPLELIDQTIKFKIKWNPRVFAIESVAYQKSLKWFVKDYADKKGIYLNVKTDIKPGGKGKPHIRGLQPIMATGRMYVNPTMHKLRDQLDQWPLGEHDDVADALALQLQLFRGTLSPEALARLKAQEAHIITTALAGGAAAAGMAPLDMVDFDLFNPPANGQRQTILTIPS